MMLMICARVTPCLTVRMTMTSVVFGVGASEGGWPDANGDCAAAANGYAARMNGRKNFMDAPQINVCRLLGSGGDHSGDEAVARPRTDDAVFSHVFTAYIRALATLCAIAGSC